MKKIIIFISLVVVLLAVGGFYWYQTAYASVGSLNIYQGDVEVVRGKNILSGKTGTGVRGTDVIKVKPGSRVSVILKDGSVVRLEENSELSINQLEYPKGGINAVLKLKTGRVWSHVQHHDNNTNYKVETPSVVATVSGTGFNVGYLNKTSNIYVYKSAVRVQLLNNLGSEKRVSQSELFAIRDEDLSGDYQKGPQPVESSFIDDWVLFNQREDDKLDGVASEDNSVPVISTTTPEVATSTPVSETNTSTPSSTPTTSPKAVPANTSSSNAASAPATAAPPSPTTDPAPVKQITRLDLTTSNQTVVKPNSVILKVIATYNDNSQANVTMQVAWSQKPEIGSISRDGYYSGVMAGQTTITASLNAVTSNPIALTVQDGVTLQSIRVSYVKQTSTATTNYSYPTAQFTATGVYSNNTTKDITSQVSWGASGSAKGSISASGYYTAQARGTDTVTATSQGVSGSTTINIP